MFSFYTTAISYHLLTLKSSTGLLPMIPIASQNVSPIISNNEFFWVKGVYFYIQLLNVALIIIFSLLSHVCIFIYPIILWISGVARSLSSKLEKWC